MEVIEFVGLPHRSRVRALSGGQRRRLDVAIGIVGRPRLLFLDEPTTGFDPEARRRFWALIKALDDTTIVLTTHYLDEAEALADRVAVLAKGIIVAQGDPRTLGGRAEAKATIRWRGGCEQTDDPVALICRLRDMPELTVTRPSLEDIYLNLIGEHR
jgi:ABC-2 type transport system ATP-binding protein